VALGRQGKMRVIELLADRPVRLFYGGRKYDR
jgi:hypothetical protein